MNIEFDAGELMTFLRLVHRPMKSIYSNEDIDLCEFCGWSGKPGGFNAHLHTVFNNAREGRFL